jgi:cold shock CspA family protein
MPRGTVKTFEAEKGFGTLLLETGEEVPFDISVSNKRDVAIGAAAEVTVGVGLTGKPKAKLVLFELEEDRAPSFAAGFKQLQKLGFFAEWDAKQAKAAAKELLEEVPTKLLRAHVGGLFQHYYGEGLTSRGKAEGVITLDWRAGQVTRTPEQDLLALCSAAFADVDVRRDGDRVLVGGEAVDLTRGLEPLVNALNGVVAARGDRRFFALDVDSDFYVIVWRGHELARLVRDVSVLKLG